MSFSLDTLLGLVTTHQILVVFVGMMFFGDTFLLAVSYLSGQGVLSPWTILWAGFLGTMFADLIWFYIGHLTNTTLSRFFDKYRHRMEHVLGLMEKLVGKRPFVYLILAKFLYGTRILIIIYVALRKMPVKTFILFDAVGTVLLHTVLIGMGWLAGRGIAEIAIFSKIQYSIAFLVLFVLVIKFVAKVTSSKLTGIEDSEEETK